jgi:hypothetical protein
MRSLKCSERLPLGDLHCLLRHIGMRLRVLDLEALNPTRRAAMALYLFSCQVLSYLYGEESTEGDTPEYSNGAV